jgi:hypothetical protein
MITKPQIIHFPKIGNSALGYISVAEDNNIPFDIKRVYWTYYTPESIHRGGHAHVELEQILIAVSGKIIVETEMPDGEKDRFILEAPSMGIFLPKYCWHIMQYTHTAVQMCIANMVYTESDYIRDYEVFKKIQL